MARREIDGIRGILTGASSGIGQALARELALSGAQLVIVARRAERLEALAQELHDAPGRVECVPGDITLDQTRTAAIERARDAFGGLDLVVNNAGTGAMGQFAETAPERLRQVMELNFFAAAELTRSALPLLVEGRHPIVVNVSSVLGHRGVPGYSEYCASKFAMQGLSESLRAEFAPLGIDLLVVSPGRTETEFFDSAIGAQGRPWKELPTMTPEAVARQIAWAIRRGKHEIVISRGGKLLVWSSRLFPGVLDWVLARQTGK
ncbi:MAG: short chain dehydrogenase [Planctomycetota bacterium]|nr:MAG: short chain dehydrogenase [Planctomycetota bacterium]